MENNGNRIVVLDYVRAIAVLMVVFNHAISTFYVDQLNPSLYNSISNKSQFFMVNSYIISRLGVPLFLFLTGALILNKKFENFTEIKLFYKKNLLSLLITVVVWNIVYYFMNLKLTDTSFYFGDLLLTILFLKKSIYGHMWYMSMIIGIYLYLPFVSLIIKKYDIKKMMIPIVVSIVTFFVIPYLSVVLNQHNPNISLIAIYDTNFSGAQYGLYIILGYYIFNKQLFSKISIKLKCLLILIGYISSVVLQVYLYKTGTRIIVYYNFIGILLFSSVIFSIFVNGNLKGNKIIEYLSKNSLGIFFVHFPVLILLKKYLDLHVNRPALVVLFYIMCISISIIINEILKLFKVTRIYLLRQNQQKK